MNVLRAVGAARSRTSGAAVRRYITATMLSADHSDVSERPAYRGETAKTRIIETIRRGRGGAGRTRPRVVIATRIFLPEPAAASNRLGSLVGSLAACGAQVRVLTTTVPERLGSGPTPAENEHVQIRRFPVLRGKDGYVRGYSHYLSFDLPLALRLLLGRRPDVVVCEPPPTTGLVVRGVCALRRVPYVYYAADIWSDASAGAGRPTPVVAVVRAAERAAIRGARAVLSVSESVTRQLRPWRSTGVTTVGHGVDTALFSTVGPTQQLGAPYFLYAGTASEVHGAPIFVAAFRRVVAVRPDVRLVFIGQGTDFTAIAAGAPGVPAGAVVVLPRVPPEKVAEWMRGAVATLASVKPGAGYDYAVPTKAYASLACGIPVILTGPSPLARSILEADIGWAVAYEVEAVAASMVEALAAPRTRRRQSEIRSWAEEHVSAQQVSDRAAQVVLRAASARR